MSAPRFREPPPARRRSWLRWTLVAAGIAILVLLGFRKPLSDRIWPEARAQALSDQAAHALARGHLTAPDGTGARELYEAALAIDPDRSDARVGLMAVAQVALAQARSATASNHYADAHRALQLARALSVPRAQADMVEEQLRANEAGHAGIADLLAQAAAARAAHRLDGSAAAALPLYQRVLTLQPDRVEALEGREDALSDLLQTARQAMQRDDLPAAARLITTARGYDPGHADLPAVQAEFGKAADAIRRRADTALRRDQLERAADGYRMLLQIDASDAAARRGLDRIAADWARRAGRLAADFRFSDADKALAQARALAPQAPAVHDAEHALAHAQQTKQRMGGMLPPSQRAQRVRELLQGAATAEAQGNLLTPPGDSAFDKLRAARALAPDDATVRAAGARLLPVAKDCFERELRRNSLQRARECLDATIALAASSDAVAQDKRRLAQRWAAVGEERLGAGDIAGARSALAFAQALDPRPAEVAAFAQRVRIASGGH